VPVKNPRYRVVNFRLSDDEYERVYCSCQAEGVRSVSDFARSSVLSRAEGNFPGEINAGPWLLGLSQTVAKLDEEVREVLDWIRLEKRRLSRESVGTSADG
jgi:hypothetical protein